MKNWLSFKSFYPCVFILFCFLVIYSTITLNSCVVNNLKHLLRKHGRVALDLITSDDVEVIPAQNVPETYVRVVPLETVSDSFDSVVDGAPKYRFLRQQGLQPQRRLPDAIIIGVKKGGTRALLEFSRLHPDVRAAGSEIHFFDKYYNRGLRWYKRKMPFTLEGQVTMEKSPSYFITKEVPNRIRRMNSYTKLIVVVRNPITRLVSDYAQASSKKSEMRPFEELAFRNGTEGPVDTTWGPVRIGVYAKHLDHWLRFFPLKQFLFVSGERLIVDPAAEMARLQDFLGLKRVVTEKYFYFNATKGFPCLLKSEGRSTPHCLGKTKGRNHPTIDPAVLQRLRQFYRPFNERFYQMTGINFDIICPFLMLKRGNRLSQRCFAILKRPYCQDNSNNIELPPEPTACCMSGCANCVWIAYAEEVANLLGDGALARKILMEKVKDPNLRSFLLLEIGNLTKKEVEEK